MHSCSISDWRRLQATVIIAYMPSRGWAQCGEVTIPEAASRPHIARVCGAVSLQDGPGTAAKLDSLTRLMSWVRQPQDSPLDLESSEGLLAAVDDISEELLEGFEDIDDILAEPLPDEEVSVAALVTDILSRPHVFDHDTQPGDEVRKYVTAQLPMRDAAAPAYQHFVSK